MEQYMRNDNKQVYLIEIDTEMDKFFEALRLIDPTVKTRTMSCRTLDEYDFRRDMDDYLGA